MSGVRPPFDPGGHFVVASQELVHGMRRYKRGDVFPARELQLSAEDVFTLWVALKIDNGAPLKRPAARR